MKQFILCILALFVFTSCKDYSHVEKFPYPERIEIGEFVYRRSDIWINTYFLEKAPKDLVVSAVSTGNNSKGLRLLRKRIREQYPNCLLQFSSYDYSITRITIYDCYTDLIRPSADKMFIQYMK